MSEKAVLGRERVKSSYSSRERILCTMSHEEPDHVPLWNIWRKKDLPFDCHNEFQALKYILKEPTRDQIAEFRDRAKRLRDFARNKGAMLDGGWLYSMDMAIWLYGFEQLTLEVMDDQGLVEELLEVILRWERPRLELLLEEKVDLIVHSAWYELPHYWSPGLFRKLMKPILKREIDLCHSAGVPFCYILTAGSSMVLDDLLEIGVDAIRGIDPVQGYNDDLAATKEKVGDRITLWGGINSAVTLGRGTPDEIREAVDVAIEIFAPGGGFVMYPVDQVFTDTPMENFEIMVERWKAISSYTRFS